MQLNEVSAKAGYLWFRQGVWLFRRNPLALLMLFFTYMFAMLVLSYIPLLGPVLPFVLVPTVSVAFMIACRDTIVGKPVLPTTLAAGLHLYGRGVARQLLTLGLMYMVAFALVLAVSTLVDGGLLVNLLVYGGGDAALANSNESLTLIAMMAAYVPVSMLFWFAPVLVAWHEVPPHKALFFSFVACWRNRTAFGLYCLIWGAVIFGVMSILGTVLMALDLSVSALIAVMAPVYVTLGTTLFCSFYATYRGCFTVPGAAADGSAAKSPGTLD